MQLITWFTKKKEEEFALNLLRRMLGDEHVFTPKERETSKTLKRGWHLHE
jgi:hypothetical protein